MVLKCFFISPVDSPRHRANPGIFYWTIKILSLLYPTVFFSTALLYHSWALHWKLSLYMRVKIIVCVWMWRDYLDAHQWVTHKLAFRPHPIQTALTPQQASMQANVKLFPTYDHTIWYTYINKIKYKKSWLQNTLFLWRMLFLPPTLLCMCVCVLQPLYTAEILYLWCLPLCPYIYQGSPCVIYL